MIRNILLFSLVVLGSLVLSPDTYAKPSKEVTKSFNKKYKEFRKNFDNRAEYSQVLSDKAKEVYQLAQKVYDNDDQSLAALGEIYTATMNNKFNMDDYVSVLEESIRIYKKHNNKLVVDLYFELGNYYVRQTNSDKAFKQYARATNLAQKMLSKEKAVGIKLIVGKLYYKHSMGKKTNYSKSLRILREAASYYEEKDQGKFADASFWMGKSLLALRKASGAIEQFNLASDIFSTLKNERKNERISRTFLVQALMENGQEELASKQCLEVGKLSSWDDNAEITPLYIVQPKYPRSALKSGEGGWVKFAFQVNLDGEASNITVIENKGHKGFIKEGTRSNSKVAICTEVRRWKTGCS